MGEDDKNYSQEIQDRIRELAHSMWEWAGRQQDMALHYWVVAEKEVLATLRAAADKLVPGEPEKAEKSITDAAKPAPSEPPGPAEAAVEPPSKTEETEESKAEAAKRTKGRTRT
jgi:hypothetical protein